METVFASVVAQLKVAELPDAMDAGFTVNVIVGAGALGVGVGAGVGGGVDVGVVLPPLAVSVFPAPHDKTRGRSRRLTSSRALVRTIAPRNRQHAKSWNR
jgi:hypothetical protein